MIKAIDRRKFLLGAGGVAVALPFLEAMQARNVRAQDARVRRIIFEFKPNGDETDRRFGTLGETDFTLGEFLAPLEPYRKDLLFLHRINKQFDNIPLLERADRHQQGGSSLAPWAFGEGDFPVGGEDRSIGYVLGPSADYVIGDRIIAENPAVPYRHLVHRVGDRENNIWNLSAHAGPIGQKNPVIPETDPYDAYSRLFSFLDPQAGSNTIEHNLAMDRSVLDLVGTQLRDLQGKVSYQDRLRLELHSEAIRDLERTLVSGNAVQQCRAIALGGGLDPYADDAHVQLASLFFRITALAFACDLTRVVNFNWSGNTSQRIYSNLGISEGHHDISHRSDVPSFDLIRQIHQHLWTGSTMLYEELLATPDGDGSLWDSTAIVHWNELGQGDLHSTDDNLVVIAGGAQGYFKKNRLLDYERGAAFSDLLATCFQYMGMEDVEQFGDARMSMGQGPLGDVVA
jgi:hypothetical protein